MNFKTLKLFNSPRIHCRNRWFFLSAFFFLLCGVYEGCKGLDFLPGPVADPTGRYLAGLPIDQTSPLGLIAREPSAITHAEMIRVAFEQFEVARISRMKEWAPKALGHLYRSSAPLFYMFSGPDFLYATHFFPATSTTVLCGLEPVGTFPDLGNMSSEARQNGLAHLRNSLETILSYSFFRTKDMKTDLRGHAFEGTAPLLLCFLARTGKMIMDARLTLLDADGKLYSYVPEYANDTRRFVKGIRIVYRDNYINHGLQTLYYFSTDISDSGLSRHGGLLKLCASLGRGNGFVKSASYLMHENYFSKVRSFLLEHCDHLLQDDSGIPLRFFDKTVWSIRIYGTYLGPIELFKGKYQPDLAALYKKTTPAPLTFGIGYRHRPGTSTLMLAMRGPANPQPVPDDETPLPISPSRPGEPEMVKEEDLSSKRIIPQEP